jgi:hypothetical protein
MAECRRPRNGVLWKTRKSEALPTGRTELTYADRKPGGTHTYVSKNEGLPVHMLHLVKGKEAEIHIPILDVNEPVRRISDAIDGKFHFSSSLPPGICARLLYDLLHRYDSSKNIGTCREGDNTRL